MLTALKKASVTDQDTLIFSEKTAGLDLEPIKFKLVKTLGWTIEDADRVEVLYKQYLTLSYLYPQAGIVPTKEVDAFWHQHILDTAKYTDDCQNLFGYFLHHYPYFGLRGLEDAQDLSDAFDRTRDLYLEHFGVSLCTDLGASECRDDCVSLSLKPLIGPCVASDCGDESNDLAFFRIQERPRLERTA